MINNSLLKMTRYFDVNTLQVDTGENTDNQDASPSDLFSKYKELLNEKLELEQNEIHEPVDQSRKHKRKFENKGLKKDLNQKDQVVLPNKVPIPPEKLVKYSRGEGVGELPYIKNLAHKKRLLKRERKIKYAEEQAARTEILLTEETGFLIPEEGEHPKRITQTDLKNAVDITSAAKSFELNLQYGPYRMDYSRNGRYLLLGGKRGHLAAFDWVTKRLMCEINVVESIFDVQWLHVETMFAVAQKEWVYIYNNQGVEMHCVKGLYRVLRMTFLPYHFLLATSAENGWLNWLDISIGKMVNSFSTKQGRLGVMVQNPYNAVLCLGHSKGVVSMWSPNSNKPLAQMLCHNTGVQSIAIDSTGNFMATSSADRQLKIWDVRQLVGPIHSYQMRGSATDLSFSQKGLLAAAISNTVEIFKDCHMKSVTDCYLRHRGRKPIYNIQFCPYEDVLGLGTEDGYTSLLVPGSGEANYDAFECNPIQSKAQRREAEVKSLLEKIQPEMITLDPSIITEVDLPTMKDKVEAAKKLLYLKPPKIDFEPRKKKKPGNSVRAAKVKKIVQETRKREFFKEIKEAKEQMPGDLLEESEAPKKEKISALDRFRQKK